MPGKYKYKSSPRFRCYRLFHGAKHRASIANLPFDLTNEYIFDLWKEQDGCCAITGVEFNTSAPKKKSHPLWDSASLDRVIPEKGYIKGNVRLVCYQVNCAIGSYGLDQFINLCKLVIREIG